MRRAGLQYRRLDSRLAGLDGTRLTIPNPASPAFHTAPSRAFPNRTPPRRLYVSATVLSGPRRDKPHPACARRRACVPLHIVPGPTSTDRTPPCLRSATVLALAYRDRPDLALPCLRNLSVPCHVERSAHSTGSKAGRQPRIAVRNRASSSMSAASRHQPRRMLSFFSTRALRSSVSASTSLRMR